MQFIICNVNNEFYILVSLLLFIYALHISQGSLALLALFCLSGSIVNCCALCFARLRK
jgi:hypothetical protein